MDNLHEQIKELTLMLLFLNSWEENEFGMKYHRSWKGYDFNMLNELADFGYINDGRRSKSISFNDAGIERAMELIKKYGINYVEIEPK